MIEIRLRVPLKLWSHHDRILATYHPDMPPTLSVPARTTLRIADLFNDYALALTPQGTPFSLSRETIREHAYIPRQRTSQTTR